MKHHKETQIQENQAGKENTIPIQHKDFPKHHENDGHDHDHR